MLIEHVADFKSEWKRNVRILVLLAILLGIGFWQYNRWRVAETQAENERAVKQFSKALYRERN